MKFYNVRKREFVNIPESNCKKLVYTRERPNGEIQERYAIRAIDEDGTKLTKFITKDVYKTLYMEQYDPYKHDKVTKGFFSKLLGLN